MRKSKFSETQIVEILKDAEGGIPVADLLRKHGISKATFFKWRSKYGGASVADVKRLRELEAGNAKLKRMYADLALENAAIKDVLNRRLQPAGARHLPSVKHPPPRKCRYHSPLRRPCEIDRCRYRDPPRRITVCASVNSPRFRVTIPN